jgi:hypothetical protein
MKLILNMNKAMDLRKGGGGGGPFIGPRGGKWADPQFKIPWHEKKHAGKPAPKAKDHDEHGATELQLHIENTYGHHGHHEVIRNNMANHVARGTYDHGQAVRGFQKLADAGSKQYQKEFGTGSGHAFDPHTRLHVARELADQFHDETQYGEHDHRLNKKHQKMHPKGIAHVARKHGK